MARKLTDWLTAYTKYTEDWEPPGIFNTWCGLVVLSAATGRKVWMQEANTQLFPNLFVVFVGPSGCGKTSAMREAQPFIEHLGQKYGLGVSPAKITARKLWTRMEESTTAVDGMGLMTPYAIWVEEFPSFLGSDAYRSGMLADLTAVYDCPEKWEKETQTAGDVSIVKPYVVLQAGATASGLFDVLPPGSVAQGFTARLLFVAGDYPETKVVDKPWKEKHKELHKLLIHDLDEIAATRGVMQMSDVAKALWADFYMNRPDPDEEYADARLQGYASRKPLYVKKLGMLLALSEGSGMVIEAQHLEMALELLGGIDKSITKIYGEIAPRVTINAYPKLLKVLKKAGGQLSHAELFRRFSYILDAREFEATLQAMEGMGLIAAEVGPANSTRAWQKRRYYKMTGEGKRWLQDR